VTTIFGSGNDPLQAWISALQIISSNGIRHGSIRELTHLAISVKNGRPLRRAELRKYKEIVGEAAWNRIRSVYSEQTNLSWKPSYMRRLLHWHAGTRVINQWEDLKRRARRHPGSNALCCTILVPPDVRRYIAASIPCLATVDFKIRDGRVNVAGFFRSQDVFRFFLGDYNKLCELGEEVAAAVSGARRSATQIVRVDLILCSGHYHGSTRLASTVEKAVGL
jgi:thymidylate synthase